jgi:hypothetical protein
MAARKLLKFLILFDNTNLLYFPGQFLSGRVLIELEDDTPALGKVSSPLNGQRNSAYRETGRSKRNIGGCTYNDNILMLPSNGSEL